MEATLAMVHYMQHLIRVTKIGPSHVRTAFHDAGMPIPADVRQTIRNMKVNKAWLDFTDNDDIKTTTQGDNFVLHQMGKSSKSE
jgi:hypothetical protein